MTQFGAKTMALDPKTHNILVSTEDFDQPATSTERQPIRDNEETGRGPGLRRANARVRF
jgi:hypothetical protein